MDEIRRLIEEGRQELAARAAEEAANLAEKERLRKEQQEALEAGFAGSVHRALPEMLYPYVQRYSELDQWSQLAYAWLEIPQCSLLRVDFKWGRQADIWAWSGKYAVASRHYIQDGYASEPAEIRHEWEIYEASDLHLALAMAAEAYEERVQLEEQLAEWEAAAVARRKEREAYEVEWEIREREQESRAEEQQERLWAVLDGDPVAMGLVRLFMAVQYERDRWNEQRAAADDALMRSEERYRERLEQANRTADDAQREADRYRDEAWQAEEKVKKLEREARRGW